MTHRILFVCLGNICRSPSAEGVLRNKANARGMSLSIDSAGTGDWHVGKPPYAPMQAAAKARGYDLSQLRARQVSAADFERFDLIIAMDADNRFNLEQLRPAGSETQVVVFTDFAAGSGADHVPDPYYTRDFDGALSLIEQASDGLLDHIAP